MILTIFILLLSICAVLMFFGYYSKIRMFSMVGLIILFLLGSWIILYNYTGKDAYGLQYETGTVETYSYMCSSCVDSRFSNSTGNNSVIASKTITPIYSTYNDTNDKTAFWVGWLLSIIGLSGMFLVLLNDK